MFFWPPLNFRLQKCKDEWGNTNCLHFRVWKLSVLWRAGENGRRRPCHLCTCQSGCWDGSPPHSNSQTDRLHFLARRPLLADCLHIYISILTARACCCFKLLSIWHQWKSITSCLAEGCLCLIYLFMNSSHHLLINSVLIIGKQMSRWLLILIWYQAMLYVLFELNFIYD